MHYSPSIQLTGSGRRTHERRQPPATDSLSAQTRQSRMDCYAHATVPKSADKRSGGGCVMTPSPIVFLIDVDNTLLDNDRIQSDLKRHLEREFGAACRDRYWAILEQLFTELGYRDYLGALQRYRVEHPQDIHLLSISSHLVDYPFASRLYPGALDVLKRLRNCGQTVVLSDGGVVFQPR